MVLENIVSRRLTLQPIGRGQWEVGSRATGFFSGDSPQEALEAWAEENEPNMLRVQNEPSTLEQGNGGEKAGKKAVAG